MRPHHTNANNGNRDSGLELLRFISIFLILMHHACISGSLEIFKLPFAPINHGIVSVLGIWGMFGVDIFFLISFWFMLDESFVFRIEKWFRLVIEVVILALTAYAVSCFFFNEAFSLRAMIKAILSPALNTYWYITVYLIVFLCIPFFRIINEKLDDKDIITLFCILFFVVPVYRGGYGAAPINNLDYGVYMVIATMLVKRFEFGIKKYALLGSIVFMAACIGGIYIALYMGKGQGMLYELCVNRFSPLQSLSALFVFVFFKNRIILKNKVVNFLAKGILGIYILHASPSIAQHIWIDTFEMVEAFKTSTTFTSKLIMASFTVLVVFLPVSILIHGIMSKLKVKGKSINWINERLNFTIEN